jgi:hypothetical protein
VVDKGRDFSRLPAAGPGRAGTVSKRKAFSVEDTAADPANLMRLVGSEPHLLGRLFYRSPQGKQPVTGMVSAGNFAAYKT